MAWGCFFFSCGASQAFFLSSSCNNSWLLPFPAKKRQLVLSFFLSSSQVAAQLFLLLHTVLGELFLASTFLSKACSGYCQEQLTNKHLRGTCSLGFSCIFAFFQAEQPIRFCSVYAAKPPTASGEAVGPFFWGAPIR